MAQTITSSSESESEYDLSDPEAKVMSEAHSDDVESELSQSDAAETMSVLAGVS